MNQIIKTNNIDFSQLVQNNSTLTVNFQSNLIKKLEETFTESEQRWYIANLYMYINYHPTEDFPIDLENVYKLIGFAHKKNAKRTLENNFTLNEDYKTLLLRREQQKVHDKNKDSRGGYNAEQILLNVDTFKNLCMLTKSEESKKIRGYYVKLETIYNKLVLEEKKEYEKQLEDQQTHILQLESNNVQLKKEKELERHTILLREFAHVGSIVYIVRVKSYENGEYIIKIGESRRGIAARYIEHKQKYEETVVLDCFTVYRSKDFERFLHTHNDIQCNKVTDLQGHETEHELFLIGKNLSYLQLKRIIEQNIKYYNDMNHLQMELDQSKLEIEKLQMLNQMHVTSEATDNIINILAHNNNLLMNEIKNLTAVFRNEIGELKQALQETRTTNNFNEPLATLGPRVQKINPETLQLVQVYESVTECMRENQNIKRPSLNKAVVENTVYCGARWLLVERSMDPNVIHNLQPTKITRPQNVGYVAKLDSNKSRIFNVYLDRKTASNSNDYPSPSSLDDVVKHGKLSRNHYYVLYDDCSDELKRAFPVPLLYKNGVGKFDANHNLVAEFVCKEDCRIKDGMGHKSLTKALDRGIMYNNFYYKFLGSKLQCL